MLKKIYTALLGVTFAILSLQGYGTCETTGEVIETADSSAMAFQSALNNLPTAAEKTEKLVAFLNMENFKSQALHELALHDEDELHPLFEAMFKGNIYHYGIDSQLVIAGPEMESNGSQIMQLFKPYPFQPLKDSAGALLFVGSSDLAEFETDREMRSLLQPLLTAWDLKSPEIEKRKNAAQNVSASGDTLQMGKLERALAIEKNKSVTLLLQEGIARLQMLSPDANKRIMAANVLGKIHAQNVLSELNAKITPDASGHFLEADANVRVAIVAAVRAIDGWNRITGFIQLIFTGISLGSILILMALGLAIIFGLMGVINMAHGEFMMIGAYATYLMQNFFHHYLPEQYFGYFFAFSFPFAFICAGSIGFVVETLIIKRLYGRPLETLLATWGISLIFVQIARQIFGDLTAVTTPHFLSQGWEIFPQVVLPFNRIFIVLLTVVIVLAMTWVFYRTRMGIKIRAVTQNRPMSSCLGIATRKIDAMTFALGTGIAGIAGCALTLIGNVDPGMGQNYIVDSFMVVVTGGVGKLAGTVISGLGIGLLNKFLEPAFQAVYAKVLLLVLVILFLQIRPSGLFPAKGRNED